MNNELAPQLKVLHFGRLCKKSVDEANKAPVFHARWSVLTYGIFTYFRTCEKAKQFLDALPCSQPTDIHFTKDQHRMAFKDCLKQHPPRGYIKLLNRDGIPVSKMTVNHSEKSLVITHKNRDFHLRMDTAQSFDSWMDSFKDLGIEITYTHKEKEEEETEEDTHSTGASTLTTATNSKHCKQETTESEQAEEKSHTIEQASTQSQSMGHEDDEETDQLAEMVKKTKLIDYDEEDERLLEESKRLEDLLKKDQTKILQSFSDIRKSIISKPES